MATSLKAPWDIVDNLNGTIIDKVFDNKALWCRAGDVYDGGVKKRLDVAATAFRFSFIQAS